MMNTLRKRVKPIMLFIVIIFAVSIFFTYGTGGGGGVSAVAAGGGVSGDVLEDYDVAIVDGERIKLSRLEKEVGEFVKTMGLEANATSEDLPAFRNTVIDRLATLKELDKEIASRKITVTKEEIDTAVKEIESQFPTKEIYFQELQAIGITEAEFRSSVEENIKRGKLMDEVTGVVSTDAVEIRRFYDMMKEYAFQKPEGFMMDVAHFSTGAAAESAKKELESGKAWGDVVAAASADMTDHETAKNRMFIPAEQLAGDVEFLKELSMDVPSKVIELASEDHMIVVKRAKEEAGVASFDEVSADIEQMLLNQKKSSLQSNFMQELRERASVQLLDEELFKIPAPETSGDVPPSSADVSDAPQPVASQDAPEASVSGDAPAVTSGE
jgi:hypothetical protein